MSQTTSPTGVEHLADRITAGTERLLREATTDGSNDALAATAAELWDVVAEVDDLLETIDFENLPDAVNVSALPDLVELDQLPNAIREKDLDQIL